MAKYRLKPNHPVAQKIDKLNAFLTENNMELSTNPNGGFIVNIDNHDYNIEDIDTPSDIITELPPAFEYKITFNE